MNKVVAGFMSAMKRLPQTMANAPATVACRDAFTSALERYPRTMMTASAAVMGAVATALTIPISHNPHEQHRQGRELSEVIRRNGDNAPQLLAEMISLGRTSPLVARYAQNCLNNSTTNLTPQPTAGQINHLYNASDFRACMDNTAAKLLNTPTRAAEAINFGKGMIPASAFIGFYVGCFLASEKKRKHRPDGSQPA